MKKNTLHMIGNAHIDPVWLWRFPEGLAEIKATFRSALDRIAEYDEFIFTSACASYYQWIEENCPEMFLEIQAAVKAGRWNIVGGMWIQPDCNMPSTESFARHFLYSQRYFEEKFGVAAVTGYNVDSFGHAATLPRLLQAAGLQNYIYMRPAPGEEMDYPFPGNSFVWKCGESAVRTYRINDPYCNNLKDDAPLAAADGCCGDAMFFYGVGNHGGGPTIQNIEIIRDYRSRAAHDIQFSSPDLWFATTADVQLPEYEGELQNHASGCYSAYSEIKTLNRNCENRLNEAERFQLLSAAVINGCPDAEANANAWKRVLFNQFHDILCGCSVKGAYDDAKVSGSMALAHAAETANAAVQKISWAVDTHKDVPLSKEHGVLWGSEICGTPIVVFNPLSHPAFVNVTAHVNDCVRVTDARGNVLLHQIISADYVNGPMDHTFVLFRPEVPALGWTTCWVYRGESSKLENPALYVDEATLANDQIRVQFDTTTGNIASITRADGTIVCHGSRVCVIDDSPNDTWAHARFVFDAELGEFAAPTIEVLESGPILASVRVTQSYGNSTLTQTYTVLPGEAFVRVHAELFLNDRLVMVKLCVNTGVDDAAFTRELPGGMLTLIPNGRELPMQRWMHMNQLAVVNTNKYSCSANAGEMRMVIARSCHFADHFAERNQRVNLAYQDLGEQILDYALMASNDFAAITRTAEELNTVFPVVPETYHRGSLPQECTNCSVDCDNVTVIAIKPAEDGNGYIVRLAETAGKKTTAQITVQGRTFTSDLTPNALLSYRIAEQITPCTLVELPIDPKSK